MTPITHRKSLTIAFQQSLLGESSDVVDARDPAIRKRLMALGVNVSISDDSPIDVTYRFKTPLIILGQKVDLIRYEGDSGSLFYAKTQGDPIAFATRHKLIKIDRSKESQKYIHGDYFRRLSEPTKENPSPNVFFVSIEDAKSRTFTFGLQTFDG